MRIPVVRGVIDRRILVNFRVDAVSLRKFLPPPFEPQLVNGFAIAGICLIRLKDLRPPWVPRVLGHSSENAAHRIAVTWKDKGELRHGVFIPRRDTSSRLNALAGGRLFPGVHHLADFEVHESADRIELKMTSRDRSAHVNVAGEIASEIPHESVFSSLKDVSAFFEVGSVGYSPRRRDGEFDGLELRTFNWQVEPLAMHRVESSFFDDPNRFPEGSVQFDNALLMRGIEHQWHSHKPICCSAGQKNLK